MPNVLYSMHGLGRCTLGLVKEQGKTMTDKTTNYSQLLYPYLKKMQLAHDTLGSPYLGGGIRSIETLKNVYIQYTRIIYLHHVLPYYTLLESRSTIHKSCGLLKSLFLYLKKLAGTPMI